MDPSLHDVLRVHPEPCLHIDEQTVHAELTADPPAYLAFLRARLAAIASGQAVLRLPPKQILTDATGDFRVMPCVLQVGDHVQKTVKLVGTNLVQQTVRDQVTVGRAFRLHPQENYITHTFEACLLSSARTGGCVAVATGFLAERRSRIGIVGAGRVGYYTALFLASAGGVEEIAFCDLDTTRAETAAQIGSRDFGVGCVATTREGLAGLDIVVLATTSSTPLFSCTDLDAPVVVSVGADTEAQRELDATWPAAADIYVDSTDCAMVGDVRAWIASGAVTTDRLVTLLDLVGRKRSVGGHARRVFISTGSALFDNLTIDYLLERIGT